MTDTACMCVYTACMCVYTACVSIHIIWKRSKNHGKRDCIYFLVSILNDELIENAVDSAPFCLTEAEEGYCLKHVCVYYYQVSYYNYLNNTAHFQRFKLTRGAWAATAVHVRWFAFEEHIVV